MPDGGSDAPLPGYVVVRACPVHGLLPESVLAAYGLPNEAWPEDNDKCPLLMADENGCDEPLGRPHIFIYQGLFDEDA